MDRLLSIVYTSSAVRLLHDSDLQTLLDKARKRNNEFSITGLLLYCDGNFMQYIEGPRDGLLKVYDIILRDPLHHQIIELANQPVVARDFSEWSMAYRRVDAPDWLRLSTSSWEIHPKNDENYLQVSEGRLMLRSFWANCFDQPNRPKTIL